MNHARKMLIGCLLAFALLFLLPILGFGEGVTLFVFIIAIFLCHVLMMLGHKHDENHSPNHRKDVQS